MTISTIDSRTALVLVDRQRGILGASTQPYPSSQVLAQAVRLAHAFRAHDRPVVLVRVTARADGSDMVPGRTEAPRPTNRPEG